MVRLAEIKPGQVVLDPMCGAGTTLAEMLEWSRHYHVRLAQVLGGDIDKAALRAAGPNLRRLGQASLLRWDARSLPLADQCLDRILCNPPFGKQLSEPAAIGPLYRDSLQEWNRVLRPRGRAVLLVSEAGALREAAGAVHWRFIRQLRVRVLGQPAFMSAWRKD